MIKYHFQFDEETVIDFTVDESCYTCDEPDEPGTWMRLENHKCADCTIPSGERKTCPAAVAISPVINALKKRTSYENVKVTVNRNDVRFEADTTAQRAIRSLIGLLLALSTCPIMMRLRPMANFHLPFGNAKHTVFRVFGMYLIAQFLRSTENKEPDWDMTGLLDIYRKMHKVNISLANRIREACEKDAAVNAIIILDSIGQEIEFNFETHMDKLKPIFSMYLDD